MPTPGYDGAGHYTRNFSWVADDSASVGIVSDRHDTEDDEFAKALNVAFCRDGQAPATGNWNMANFKITGLGPGTGDNDAVSLSQLTGSGSSPTPEIRKSLTLTGANENGRINFMSATGVNGIGWFGADVGWFARIDDPYKVRPRLVMNNLWNGGLTATPGVDVVTLDDAGNVALTSLTANLSLDGLGQWRTTSPGWGTRLVMYSTSVNLQSIDTQTATDPYVATTLQDRIVMSPYGGNAVIDLHKKDGTAAGGSNQVRGYTGASLRWGIQLGTTEVEGTGNTGSRFFLQSYDNNGAFNFTVMYAGRNNGKVSFPQGLTGVLTLDNGIDVVGTSAVLGGNTDVYLRPNGKASGVGQTVINAAGDMSVSGEITAAGAGNGTHAGVGLMCRNGSGGAYSTGNRGNIWWSGSAAYVYIDSTAFPLTAPCDYRLKQEIKPIGSCWDKVKALRPVSFRFRDYDILKADGVEHWGFIAHELQESLLPSAATGAKDAVDDIVEVGEDGQSRVVGTRPQLQGPDPMSIIAALTAALQEAQQRIEALEARLAA